MALLFCLICCVFAFILREKAFFLNKKAERVVFFMSFCINFAARKGSAMFFKYFFSLFR